MIRILKDFLATCPQITGSKLSVNCLSDNPGSFSLETLPYLKEIKRYCDGAAVFESAFMLSYRGFYDDATDENLKNSEMFEDIAEWLKEKSILGNLPHSVFKIEAVSGANLSDASLEDARYEMELRVLYKENM